MRLAIQLPQSGPRATARGILAAARAAEAAGIDTLAVTERVLWPVDPVPLDASGATGHPPDHQRTLYDQLEVLAAVAAVTERVGLITAIVVAVLQPPAILARRVATVDQLSGGRLRLGVGQGWMRAEYEAAEVPWKRRGAGFEEHVGAMRATWGPDPVSFDGRFYAIPPSLQGPKPAQPGGVPVYVGANAPAGIARAARFADGWLPVGGLDDTWEGLERKLRAFRSATAELGRAPLPVHLRLHTQVSETDLDARSPLAGSPEQIAGDVARLEALDLGVEEICLNQTQRGVPFGEQLDATLRVRALLDPSPTDHAQEAAR
ncbi:TIGR03619 family F420-dependent LLM class oxidoreductase [Conexibacter sp. JD483]|uniref:TIGR03619 family F420-dependent LLM class oxidoreductase n=1 Tax=unclassified Conexibacter TaxID=2627773 RepID=UPI0027176BB0|nr:MULTISPECIES: TIGR03619 family F420-dependent LLM class oxidoreductase [unclassified Conexibacter]MDO8186527.1 TIGR03619 family F420-dependent LLM class oxidoreductase [Conexibacter sp. CPCC 205706]MDO8200096.1 TIGR03619 family F420-dependent LLM class oxidoreductase [Conexibacter sp. CPCC 205762]MDR9372194.1 TIGR03619 family F420-dependent LLM class oxidoreductase [Conexibacter sp. JD483]